MKKILAVALLALVLSVGASCAKPGDSGQGGVSSKEDLTGSTIGVITGTIFDGVAKSELKDIKVAYYNTVADEVAALKSGKIKAIVMDEPIARDLCNTVEGLKYLDEYLMDDQYAFAFNKSNTALKEQIDAEIRKLRENGTIEAIDKRWFGKDEAQKVLPDFDLPAVNGTLRMGTDCGASAPFDYYKDGKIVGYDVELAMYICRELGYALEIQDMNFGSLINALESGKVDFTAACMSVTEERKKSVLFSEPTYYGGVVMTVLGDEVQSAGFFERVGESFRKTFVVEARYLLILQGLGITILISVGAAILGTLLGGLICMGRRSRHRWLSGLLGGLIRLLQGVPIVVILMILYYLVFGSVDIQPVLIAIVGFAVNFAVYVAEMFRTGLDAVDKGQLEAAYAMGFSRLQAFWRISLPQAVRRILPVYRGEFVSMIKMTSVVGYIAIQDLTKMSDIIRSRTFEAFFPLVATALIYFLLAWGLAAALSLVEIRLDPARRKRRIRGIPREGSEHD